MTPPAHTRFEPTDRPGLPAILSEGARAAEDTRVPFEVGVTKVQAVAQSDDMPPEVLRQRASHLLAT